ncbi:MAG: phosphatase PAP2 family protein [Nitrospinae bacterium]|nr:phosphatase PAP2 family protein [Nitrospinota bacterium]
MQLLEDIDTYLLYAVNSGMENRFFDVLMPFVTNYRNWYFIILAVMAIMIIRDWKKGLMTILLVMAAVSISDYLNSHVVKFMFGRARPCSALPTETLRLILGCPSNPSFPSSHASNIFALTVVLVYRYRVLLIYMLTIAVLVCLSRVYLAVHYPSDVIAGGIFGILYGSMVILIYNRITGIYKENKNLNTNSTNGTNYTK